MAGRGDRVAACLTVLVALGARAEDLSPLALIALQAPQIETGQQLLLSQRLRQRLVASHRFAMVPREVSELSFSQAAFDEDGSCRGTCADRARAVAGVEILVSGRIDRADARCTVRLELTDLINDTSSQRAEVAGPCAAPGLQKTLDSAIDRILLQGGGGAISAVSATPPPPAMTGFASTAPSATRSRLRVSVQGGPGEALTAVRRALMESGLQVVDGRKAQFVLRINANVSSAAAYSNSTLVPRLATVSYELVRPGSGAMIGTGTKTGRMAHIDPTQGGALALLAAGREVATEVGQLLDAEGAR